MRKWTEAEGCCAKCGRLTEFADPRTNPNGFHLDHIYYLEKSKDDTEDNTQVLCFECHDKKTLEDLGYKERNRFDASGRVVW